MGTAPNTGPANTGPALAAGEPAPGAVKVVGGPAPVPEIGPTGGRPPAQFENAGKEPAGPITTDGGPDGKSKGGGPAAPGWTPNKRSPPGAGPLCKPVPLATGSAPVSNGD